MPGAYTFSMRFSLSERCSSLLKEVRHANEDSEERSLFSSVKDVMVPVIGVEMWVI